MADKKYRPQKKWAHNRRMRGECTTCGRKRNRYRWLCDDCQKAKTEYIARYRKAKKLAEAFRKKTMQETKA